MLNSSSINPNSQSNLYSKFGSNNLSTSKAFLSSAYGQNGFYTSNHDVQYYNVPGEVAKKSRKKAFLITFSSIFSLLAISAYAFRHKASFEPVINEAVELSKKAKDADIDKKVSSSLSNFTNLKDVSFGKLTTKFENIPIIKYIPKACTKVTEFYNNCVKNSTGKQYAGIVKEIKNCKGGENIEFKDFDELFNSLNESIQTTFKNNTITNGIFEGNAKSRLMNFINNATSENIANKNLANSENFRKAYENCKIELPEDASSELKELAKKYEKLFSDTLIPKLRDTNCGSGPTDIITSGIPIIALGAGIANAEDKEEKKSIMINIGFPLIGTVSMPFAGLFFPVLNGARAAITGLAVGQVFKSTAKFLEKVLNKNNTDKNNKIA